MRIRNSIWLLFIFNIYSCKYDDPNLNDTRKEVSIIQSILLRVVDTISYHDEKYTSEYRADSISYINSYLYPTIAIYNKLDNIYKWKANILAELARHKGQINKLSFYETLFAEKANDTLPRLISLNTFSSVPRFKFILYSDPNVRVIKKTISRIRFSRVLYDEKNGVALMVVNTADNVKGGRGKVVFLDKNKDGWNIVAESTVEFW